jgi:hypothetical protein
MMRGPDGMAACIQARRDHAGNDLAAQHGFGRVGMVADRKHRVWDHAILALLPWPWTLLVIKPTNDKLLAISPEVAGAESRRLLVTWVICTQYEWPWAALRRSHFSLG